MIVPVQDVMPTMDQRAGRSGANSFATSGGLVPVPHAAISPALKARDHKGPSSDGDGDGDGAILVPMQPYTLALRGRDGMPQLEYRQDGTANALLTPNGGRGGIGVGAIAFDTTQITNAANYSNPKAGDPCHPLAAGAHAPAIAMRESGQGFWMQDDKAGTLRAEGEDRPSRPSHVIKQGAMQVRRLTPVECARLQGFPDDYLDITVRGKPAADGPKYKALGNSWAVPNVRWIGQRIDAVESIERCKVAA